MLGEDQFGGDMQRDRLAGRFLDCVAPLLFGLLSAGAHSQTLKEIAKFDGRDLLERDSTTSPLMTTIITCFRRISVPNRPMSSICGQTG
jgi:hypothetical protein